uniref:Uncharacterized protein n=1 Tax=Cacopsylla melanoneura TaxID=428564 RepID=A0A8D8SNM1_9HEMI
MDFSVPKRILAILDFERLSIFEGFRGSFFPKFGGANFESVTKYIGFELIAILQSLSYIKESFALSTCQLTCRLYVSFLCTKKYLQSRYTFPGMFKMLFLHTYYIYEIA